MIETISEVIASIAALYGALMTMKAVKTESDEDRYKGFWGFMISNLTVMLLTINVGAYAMFLQMIAFIVPSTIGIIQLSKNKKIVYLIMFIVYIIIASFIQEAINGFSWTSYTIGLDSYSAPIAVLGSFVLISKNLSIRKYAFLMFVFADVIYIAFTLEQSWYILMAQYGIFVLISGKSYLDSLEKESPLRVAV